jgi:hypothetical protein
MQCHQPQSCRKHRRWRTKATADDVDATCYAEEADTDLGPRSAS